MKGFSLGSLINASVIQQCQGRDLEYHRRKKVLGLALTDGMVHSCYKKYCNNFEYHLHGY